MAWYGELARPILLRPTPTPAGDKPPRYIFSFRLRPPVYNSAGFARGEPELWLGTANWHAGFYYAPPRPQRGTSPRATFSHSALSCQSKIRQASPVESRSCGLAQRIGTPDSTTPHPDPSGGQAPALHFLIPPSAVSLRFGRLRPWRVGIEVDWRAHFRTLTGSLTPRICVPSTGLAGFAGTINPRTNPLIVVEKSSCLAGLSL